MDSIEELVAFLDAALVDDVKNRVVDTGEAWSMMRRDGILPVDSPPIRKEISQDLADYGFSILYASLELSKKSPSHETAKHGFRRAGLVFESIVRNGPPEIPSRGFHRLIGACSYHLGGLAAIAFSLFKSVDRDQMNLSYAERCLVDLLLRDMDSLIDRVSSYLLDNDNSDVEVTKKMDSGELSFDETISGIMMSGICKGLANYEYALKTGKKDFAERANVYLQNVINIADERAFSSIWWVATLMQHLLSDLWLQTLHEVIPLQPVTGATALYTQNRETFIASLFSKSTSHLELWPSQIDAARRAADPSDDLVVALPTSAGKTRIAELTALTALSLGKRVLIVTPLRALSAQTERSFRDAFAPIGVSISSLYGQSGLSAGDADALRSSEIVVSTPEKLDFALRSDPAIIDDIGLIVLDEGHLIGSGEREIRYEVLVQRLLRRGDAGTRRIVCLSAILPRGNALDDMTGWIRSDEEGEAIRSEWRPTRQRFGTLEWRGSAGKLSYSLNQDGAFVSNFIQQVPGRNGDSSPRPTDIKDITLFTAWEFAKQGKRSLIFVTQANWVNGYGERALRLCSKGYLENLLDAPEEIQTALTIGEEWLGAGHPAVEALKVGVAVHHGRLPSPFLREVERLLEKGVIKIIAASPTLAQGLNLNAGILLAPYLVRSGELISGEEFANVAGRAGRAFVDSEGLILHVMENRFNSRKRDWATLVHDVKARSLVSGLYLVIQEIIRRFSLLHASRPEITFEYLANNRSVWLETPDEEDEDTIEDLVERLDLIVFGLVEALDTEAENLPHLLDEALNGSLWNRYIDRLDAERKQQQMALLNARAKLIWKETTPDQRKGHYAMGLGLKTGSDFDQIVDEFAAKLDDLDLLALQGEADALTVGLIQIAEKALTLKPFLPRSGLAPNWKVVLTQWISGAAVSEIGTDNIEMVEDAFTYRLVWALETIRTRKMASGWTPVDGVPPGAAASCVDTGLPSFQMSLLVRGGLTSRSAAKAIVEQTMPDFFDGNGIREFVQSDSFNTYLAAGNWPSPKTADLVQRFKKELLSGNQSTWEKENMTYSLHESVASRDLANEYVRIRVPKLSDQAVITSVEFQPICPMPDGYKLHERGVIWGQIDPTGKQLETTRIGPKSH